LGTTIDVGWVGLGVGLQRKRRGERLMQERRGKQYLGNVIPKIDDVKYGEPFKRQVKG